MTNAICLRAPGGRQNSGLDHRRAAIARGKVPGADALERIGKAHGKSAAQVSLRYLVQMGVCSIPRTATPDHLKQNIEVFDFKLSDAEMAELKKLNATNMRVVNPPHAPKWDTP